MIGRLFLGVALGALTACGSSSGGTAGGADAAGAVGDIATDVAGQGGNTTPGDDVSLSEDAQLPSSDLVDQETTTTSGPCLAVTPASVDFGPVLVGSSDTRSVILEACGTSEVAVTAIALAANDSGSFSVGFGGLPGGAAPTAGAPLIVTPGSKLPVTIDFAPSALSPVVDGLASPERARLVFTSNADEPSTEVALSGVGSDVACPKALGKIAVDDVVTVQTVLNLLSYEGPEIVKRHWSVSAPVGSASVFEPSAEDATPTFQVDVVGTYTFTLDVWTAEGAQSCVPWQGTVVVTANEAIRVELVWETPGDPNPADTKGADLDLHFAHAGKAKNGGYDGDGDGQDDPWYAPTYDVYWMNIQPTWGPDLLTNADDPVLLMDSASGPGPEIISLGIPEGGAEYLVGVHVGKDGGFGPSLATVRVFISQALVAEYKSVSLAAADMWCVAKIGWPSGAVTTCKPNQVGNAITSNYAPPM